MPIVFRAGIQAYVQPGHAVPCGAEPKRARPHPRRQGVANGPPHSVLPPGRRRRGETREVGKVALLLGTWRYEDCVPAQVAEGHGVPQPGRKCSAKAAESVPMRASEGLAIITHSKARSRLFSCTGGHSQQQAPNGSDFRPSIQVERKPSSDLQAEKTSLEGEPAPIRISDGPPACRVIDPLGFDDVDGLRIRNRSSLRPRSARSGWDRCIAFCAGPPRSRMRTAPTNGG